MCKFTGNQLTEVEKGLRKIKAIADLLTFYERDSGGSISGESLQEIGYLLAEHSRKALAILTEEDEAPTPEFDPNIHVV